MNLEGRKGRAACATRRPDAAQRSTQGRMTRRFVEDLQSAV
jgi:hypothetical protein